ncbi:MAG: AMP-binding protein [Vicinamibacterales bacterium]|jgi:phenylacetate-CoA ligase|nr:hypothetical protein [Acidobacteriota bacterium]MDP6372282.1 AMP-binding protein [Vicinamibacterales bacterium]MDP6607661.1 AMP-binding protein [Vicinamibacterales bacterium]HAK54757.1 hypothetical protein [Acidobacteriota bacterium]|tara:strand:- start:16594 stop:17922 length:1329 start_codon:yes stop_codon:yes gene_type:complete
MATLPDYTVLDPDLRRLPLAELRALQAERLRAMVAYVYDAAPFWRRKLDAAGVTPGDVAGLDDLSRLPFCTKEELQADQVAYPPFGSYVGVGREKLTKYMTTSGTTGRPLRRVFSARDWGYVLDKFQRNPRAGPGDITVALGPVDGLMGPMAGTESAARAGAMVVLAGLYDSKTKLRVLTELRPTVVTGTASYLLYLADLAREIGVDLPGLGIRAILSVGEPGAAVPATRKRLMDGWGTFVNDGYGMTELFPLGGGCRHSTSLHIAGDFVITEIVDPGSGQAVRPGEPGEVVYTNLVGDTQPLLRYRSRDIARLATDGPCACGFTGDRLRDSIEGRVDDMIWFRGVNLYPSAIEGVVRDFEELAHEYAIVIDDTGTLPSLTLRVEARSVVEGEARNDLERRLRQALSAAVRVRATIELLPPGTLPPAVAGTKAHRVVDARSR